MKLAEAPHDIMYSLVSNRPIYASKLVKRDKMLLQISFPYEISPERDILSNFHAQVSKEKTLRINCKLMQPVPYSIEFLYYLFIRLFSHIVKGTAPGKPSKYSFAK